ncbi:MAG: AAA family ATPase [Bacteroidetes bacterium]|nr:AAA family ATPase [Bacteroidota bacterium]MBU1422674.1 AAA family ATPase [Bacteroidota bacterium]
MQITQLQIRNYKSFGESSVLVNFCGPHSLLVGKNNAGKSNILSALGLLLGTKNPNYIKLAEEDFFDSSKPIKIQLVFGNFTAQDKQELFGLSNLTQQQKGALLSKNPQDIKITFSFQHSLQNGVEEVAQETESGEIEQRQQLELKLWGFTVYRKVEDVRFALIRMLKVPAVRDASDELTGSKWTYYGQLMKAILEDSPRYGDVKGMLETLNATIREIFADQKAHLISGARVVSYVDDISFELTKEGKPSELLKNLEVFITEGKRKVNIRNTGTGTQSAVIIGILELSLKNKPSKTRVFCVEEPEVFIHPHGIRYLGDLLRKVTADGKTQVIASSHSPALIATFSPQEIIRVDKAGGETKIFQPPLGALTDEHFRRFINSENAELFFSDKVLLVEGDTEKQLLTTLGKLTPLDASAPQGESCDFDKANVGIIKLNGKENLMNFIKILEAFAIPYLALVDNDFLQSPQLKNICQKFGIQNLNNSQLIPELKNHNIIVNTKGETEDLIPDDDLAAMTGKTVQDIQQIKNSIIQEGRKTSDAFSGGRRRTNGIFNAGKVAYAIEIANFYENQNRNPIAGLTRGLCQFDKS